MTLKKALDALRSAFADFEEAARSDDKTPLKNALALGEAKDSFATTIESPSILIFTDINRFKAVNSQHGYIAGDAAIRQIGELFDERVVKRNWGHAFRISGDEFIILLHSEFLDNFRELANTFSICKVKFDNKIFEVSLSFGYAISENGVEFEVLRERAELACKKAKVVGDGSCLGWAEELSRTEFESFRKTCGACDTIIFCEVPRTSEINELASCPVCGNPL